MILNANTLQSNIKSIKASNGDKFTKAKFLGNNRFIVLAINVNIK